MTMRIIDTPNHSSYVKDGERFVGQGSRECMEHLVAGTMDVYLAKCHAERVEKGIGIESARYKAMFPPAPEVRVRQRPPRPSPI